MITLVLLLGAVCAADGPPQPVGDKLFAIQAADRALADAALADAYEKSGFTAAVLTAEWGKIERDPGSGKYDFSSFDSQPFAKSAKTRIVWVSLANPKADVISDSTRYWTLVDKFLWALVVHANGQQVKTFAYRLEGGGGAKGPSAANAEPLKHLYQIAKLASKDNVVIADQPFGSGGDAVQILYRAGCKGNYDWVAVHANSGTGEAVDPFQLVAAHRELARGGEAEKKILVLGGVQSIVNDYRNILTERDTYDPAWVAGEIIVAATKPTAELIGSFPPKIPAIKMTAQISSEGPVFSYITGKAYKLTLTLKNDSNDNIALGNWGISLTGVGKGLTANSVGTLPTVVGQGQTVTAEFTATLPDEAAGKQVTIVSAVDYTAGEQKLVADNWLTLLISAPYETTILPPRLILDPRDGTKRVGMSVINHTDTEFNGKIALTSYPGITVSPAEFDTKIDPFGLEAFVYSVTPDSKAAPGHYAVFVDIGGKVREWQAVDVPLIVSSGPKGCLEADYDRAKAASFVIGVTDNNGVFQRLGTGYVTYTPQALWLMIETDGGKPVQSLTLGFDVPANGAYASGPGYGKGDYEFSVQSGDCTLIRTQDSKPVGPEAACRFDKADGKGTACVSIPWSALAPLKPAAGTTFALGLAVRLSDGTTVEWGGGIAGQKDPRKFIPVVLAE